MKVLCTLLLFFGFTQVIQAQDSIYYYNPYNKVKIDWGKSDIEKKGRNYTITGYSPSGQKVMEGEMRDFSYDYPEMRYGNGCTAYAIATGKTLTKVIQVPVSMKTWHPNGVLKEDFDEKENSLTKYDSLGVVTDCFYYSKRYKLDSAVFFSPNGKVRSREIGEGITSTWTIQVKYEGGHAIPQSKVYAKSKIFYYPTGEKESEWKFQLEEGYYNGVYKKKFFAPNGEISTTLFQTNDFKISGVTSSYYENGQLKSTETLYRDEIKGTCRYWAENGQLIELSRKIGRQSDSVMTRWYENGNMKLWDDGETIFEWFKDGTLSREGGSNLGIEYRYAHDGRLINDNCFALAWRPSKFWIKVTHIGERDSQGFRHGTWLGYYENDSLAYRAEFNHGFQEGNFMRFTSEGLLSSEVEFVAGKPDGKNNQYYDHGGVSSNGHYKADRKVGEWKHFNYEGFLYKESQYFPFMGEVVIHQYHFDTTRMTESIFDSLHQRIETRSYQQNGYLTSLIIKSFDGKLLLEERYYPNGKLKTYQEYFPEAKKQMETYTRKKLFYDSIGNISQTKIVSVERYPQINRRYGANGTMEWETIYGFRGKDNVVTNYHYNGKVKKVSIHKPNSARTEKSVTKHYDNTGKLIKTEYLVDDEVVRTVPREKSFFD